VEIMYRKNVVWVILWSIFGAKCDVRKQFLGHFFGD
jgi:hypothetical protein